MTRLAQPFALLATGMLAGVFYYGTFTVVPAFYEVPITVHLKYRVALMNHNAVYVQLLTVIAILTPLWFAIVARQAHRVRNFAFIAAIAALLSILTTRFGNVPINRTIRVWEAGQIPSNWADILDRWNTFNYIRTVFAFCSFLFILIASRQRATGEKAG